LRVFSAYVLLLWALSSAGMFADGGGWQQKDKGKPLRTPLQYYRNFESLIGNDPVAEDASADDFLIRLRRDFNNDGREDQAIAFNSSCGNKLCNFDLWLQDAAKHYRWVGTLPILPWGYGLLAKSRGVAELQVCSGSGTQFYGMAALTISLDGISSDRERDKVLSAAGECQLAELKSYPCERCTLKELKRSGKCRWRRCE